MSNSTFPCKAVLVAAPHSGSGKTIICRGLTAALSALGLKVQTFKTGPDYIDPAHLTAASKRPCHNLDIWLMGEAACKDLWQRQTSVPPDALEWGAPDLALIEGVMGLYDGVGSTAEASSAHLARLLNVPVLLVVDVKGMGNSCSALVKGFMEFEGAPALAGLILNRVGSPAHAALLTASLQKTFGASAPPVLGALPVDPNIVVPERHLGLLTPEELAAKASIQKQDLPQNTGQNPNQNPDHSAPNADTALQNALSAWIGDNIDLQAFMQALPPVLSNRQEGPSASAPLAFSSFSDPASGSASGSCSQILNPICPKALRLAVARDRAFCFYYAENLRLLREAGFELVFFSPLQDSALPENTAGIYIGGGYPELFAKQLSCNAAMLNAIRAFSRAGGPVYAEGGGYVYLCEGLAILNAGPNAEPPALPMGKPGARPVSYPGKQIYPLLGCLPGVCEFAARRQALGYREALCLIDTILGAAQTRLRGHELRYCFLNESLPPNFEPMPSTPAPLVPVSLVPVSLVHGQAQKNPALFQLTDRQGQVSLAGSARHSTCGSFLHLHFASNPRVAENFYLACAEALG